MPKTNTPEDFWRKVERGAPNECWRWLGGLDRDGYGRAFMHSKKYVAHRLAYELAIKAPGKSLVLHSCDNPQCCNPAHLRLGTVQDNIRDKVRRRRTTAGTRNGRAILTEEDIGKMRRNYSPEKRGDAANAARAFGISHCHAMNILRNKRWQNTSHFCAVKAE